jgi:nitrate/nitrite-specific signal transduction histidine kinase
LAEPVWLMDPECRIQPSNQAAQKLFGGQISEISAEVRRRSQADERLGRETQLLRLLQHANQTLQAIRDCHQAMLRAQTERELLQDVCRIIVQSGGERMAWVGFAENDARKSVRPVAEAGVSSEYLKTVRASWANVPRGRGPVGYAIRTGKPGLCRNTQTDPHFAPWRVEARRYGFGSLLSLPLLADQRCFGALTIYAPEPDAFDPGEQLMLTDLANDLAFGIHTLRLRAERERLEDEILNSIEREQERIGRELHDGLCQLLVGAKFRSSYLQQISAGKAPVLAREAQSLEALLNRAITQARNLARGLNPVHVTPAGLPAALQKLAEDVEGAHRVHCFCLFPNPAKVPGHHVAHHLYRIAQEAVQNALKHARAGNISITLAGADHRLRLTIKDDGAGMPRTPRKSGMGLNNMRTRAKLIGGRLEIRRRKHGGTAVLCEAPLPRENHHVPRP